MILYIKFNNITTILVTYYTNCTLSGEVLLFTFSFLLFSISDGNFNIFLTCVSGLKHLTCGDIFLTVSCIDVSYLSKHSLDEVGGLCIHWKTN